MRTKSDSILVIDSGLGGISVLKELRKALPNENYIYFGDSINAPYGEKDVDTLYNIVISNINNLIKEYSIKALVLGCNTISVNLYSKIASKYDDLIVIETVPNIEDAINYDENGSVLIICTPLTTKSEYIKSEIERYCNRNIRSIGMPGLIDYVENFDFDYSKLSYYFDKNLLPYLDSDLKAVSLGCTHYPFLKDYINRYLLEKGYNVAFFDGSYITTNKLLKVLKNNDLISESNEIGDLTILNSLNNIDMIEKSFQLLEI